ncbi:MAG: putative bifunctional diguanylate cyclase/phosphodiesterase [Boseongicola sp.]
MATTFVQTAPSFRFDEAATASERLPVVRQVCLAFVGLVALALIVNFFLEIELRNRVQQALEANSRAEAYRWSSDFIKAIPNLPGIVASGTATQAQMNAMDAATAVGSVFRFKLFSPDGRTILVSDEKVFRQETDEEESNKKALRAFETEELIISVNDGTQKSNRPDVYTETYIAARLPNGTAFGVIEVYVDETQLSGALAETHNILVRNLLIAAFVIFGIPAIAYSVRSRQLQLRDRRLADLSRYDHLTGALNRSAFSELVSDAFSNRGDSSSIGLIFIDVDWLKEVNDTHGHHAGDRVLRSVSKALRSVATNEMGYFGRYGGDEFVLLLPKMNATRIAAVGKEISMEAAVPVSLRGHRYYPSISGGAYLSPPGETENKAFVKADLALYHAKDNGRNNVAFYFDELNDGREHRRRIEDRLRKGLSEKLFTLAFQPIYTAKGGLAGFEALLRLNDEYGHPIPPNEFIPIAESMGLIEKIGLWVIETAITAAATWPSDIWVSINLSGHQFNAGGLADAIHSAAQTMNVNPERIHLEVTESLLLAELADVVDQMTTLADLGYHLTMDDFGAGYSALGNLWRYRFHTLKLDNSFAENAMVNPKMFENIVSAISAMAHGMGLTVTAEGIETEEQLEIVRRTGTDFIQGYFLGRPMSESGLLALIQDHKSA